MSDNADVIPADHQESEHAMRALIQRVRNASVAVEGTTVGSCKAGLLIFLGVGPTDDAATAQTLWNKIFHLRIFGDANGRMNLSLADIQGDILVISQFTLYADCKHGRRPAFTNAAAPREAKALYQVFVELAKADCEHVGEGIFGADMQVSLINDGPVTIWLDTDDFSKKHPSQPSTSSAVQPFV